MDPAPIIPPKKKSRHLGLVLGGLVLLAVIGIAASGGSSASSVPTTPSSQTANQYQQVPVQQSTNLSNNNYYENSSGNTVHSPAYSNTVPAGASAQCGDGTYSFSQHRQGTCSHHGGVAQWLN